MAPGSDAQLRRETTFLLHVIGSSLHQHQERVASRVGLNTQQMNALQFLDAPLSQRELGELLRCEPSHVTSIVDELEGRGLVERTADPSDRRVNRVVMTEAGRALRGELRTEFRSYEPVGKLRGDDLKRLHAILLTLAERTELSHRLEAL